MVNKGIIVALVLGVLLTVGIVETNYINRQFSYFFTQLESVEQQAKANDNDTDNIDTIISWWHAQKKKLNSFIPHNEIKEIDSLLAEAKSFMVSEDFNLALSRLAKLKNYAINIPNNFTPHFENIF